MTRIHTGVALAPRRNVQKNVLYFDLQSNMVFFLKQPGKIVTIQIQGLEFVLF